ncbi:hypothetical protein VNI00_018889, partial [Paramarasmius palmivorus]
MVLSDTVTKSPDFNLIQLQLTSIMDAMDDLTQPLLTDVEGRALEIQDPIVQELASRIRLYLDKVHWHNGRVLAHQQRLEKHMESVEAAAKEVEATLGSLFKHLSDPSVTTGSKSDRRESFSTARSQPSSPETTYTDLSYEDMVRDVPLTPNGGHAQVAREDIVMQGPTSHSDKAT